MRTLLLLTLALAVTSLVRGQDLEPRRWSHLPAGLSVIGGGYANTNGDLFFDPVLQLENVEVEMHSAIVSGMHSFAVAGKSARVDLILPYKKAEWTGLLEGMPASTRRDGLGDPRIRLSVNLLGAPPLEGKDYVDYRAAHPVSTTLGLGLAITLPLGEYQPERLLNLGQNRFTVRPQLGVLHTRGPWSFELTGSLFFFTDNDDFFGGNELQRDPIYALQAHVVRTFGRGWWVAAGAAGGLGGETEVNGVNSDNHIGDLLFGASFGLPVTKNQGAKLTYLGTRTHELVGIDADTFIVAWSIRF